MPHNSPNLGALTANEASQLEQIAGMALIGFGHEIDNAKLRLSQAAAGSRYEAANRGELADAERLHAFAGQLQRGAHIRCQQARRDECIAARVIHAFAIMAMAEPAPAQAVAA